MLAHGPHEFRSLCAGLLDKFSGDFDSRLELCLDAYMTAEVDVKIHSNSTHVLIYVSVLGKIFVGCVEIEVIEDLHERFDMSPEDAMSYVVSHQEAFADIVLAKFVSSPRSFAAIPGTPHVLKSELQLKDWGLFSRPFLMPDLSPTIDS
jgi:hypothetical protein